MLLLLLLLLLGGCASSPPHSLFCRSCGDTLFSSSAHIAGTALSGPRVHSVTHEPLLDEQAGALHTLKKSSRVAGQVPVALFREAEQGAVATGLEVKPPVFEGFLQRSMACSRCGASLGWRFTRALPEELLAEAELLSEPRQEGSSPQASASSSSAAPEAEAEQSSTEAAAGQDSRALFEALPSLSKCLQLRQVWWTIVYCHRDRVEQFHQFPAQDPSKAPSAKEVKTVRWSMGSFASAEFSKEVREQARMAC